MDRIEEFLAKVNEQEDLKPLLKTIQPVPTKELDNSFIKHDPTRLQIDLGDRSIYVFGRTQGDDWMYFCTIYSKSGAPAGAGFWAAYEAADHLIAHIRSQLAIARISQSGTGA